MRHPKCEKPDVLGQKIKRTFAASRGTYGTRRIKSALKKEGLASSRSTIAKKMKQYGLVARARRNNELKKEAMSCFTNRNIKRAHLLQNQFLQEIKNSDEDHCSCSVKCKYHGKCVDCVIIHRGHGEHLPNCFHNMTNKKIKHCSNLTEHSFKLDL